MRGGRRSTLIGKNRCLVTLALVSPRRNSRSRAQTSIFTIENQHFLVQMAPEASWPPDVSAESLEARSPQPGVLSQALLARILQPGVLSQEFAAKVPQPGVSSQSVWGPRWSHFCCNLKYGLGYFPNILNLPNKIFRPFRMCSY